MLEWVGGLTLFFFLLRWIPVFTFEERGSEDLDYRGDFRNIYIRYVEGDFPLYKSVGGLGDIKETISSLHISKCFCCIAWGSVGQWRLACVCGGYETYVIRTSRDSSKMPLIPVFM
jgi:hypothetical protein